MTTDYLRLAHAGAIARQIRDEAEDSTTATVGLAIAVEILVLEVLRLKACMEPER